jgi:hypothetical protein
LDNGVGHFVLHRPTLFPLLSVQADHLVPRLPLGREDSVELGRGVPGQGVSSLSPVAAGLHLAKLTHNL